ncbi:hypothetical protein ACHAW5_003517 [Stephanodiscus triporus]|uniref:Protein kinase domain-containing protein n=1 Tax=Stephanodiscus triporus TaxID=2934178 RepID=A0ABD3NRU4_9STRA
MAVPPPAALASLSLPALSVAMLGLPLRGGGRRRRRHHHRDDDDVDVGRGGSSGSSSSRRPTISSSSNSPASTRDERFAIRTSDNVSRMYARRVIDSARLVGEHPWAAEAGGGRTTKDDILRRAFLSLIELRERMDGIGEAGREIVVNLPSSSSMTTSVVAGCESSSPKQRTLDSYNLLDDGRSSSSSYADEKPAEWTDRIDLARRRDEFGKMISPLSSTTRLERWGMACRRVLTLTFLAAPLAALVPANFVLGNLVGTTPSSSAAASEGSGGEDDVAGREGGEEGTTSSSSYSLIRCHRALTRWTWDYALWAIESAGPTYVKLVQWASTRHDLFSPEFVSHFSKLQDETRGHEWRETEAALVRAFGKDWKSVLTFDCVIDDGDGDGDGAPATGGGGGRGAPGELQRRGGAANRARQGRLRSSSSDSSPSASAPTIPIGSGCVAQVYKARLTVHHGLHPPGTSVAVKVQHPRILEKVCLDFYILNKIASFLEYIPYLNLDYLSVKDSVDQFRDVMLPQLDLRVEAHNLRRFRRDFEGETRIAFPEPLMGLTSREVLVERFVEGEPMLNYVLKEDEHHSRKDREELATIGLETVMKMIFLHDFIHADLHPGNMIVDRNKSARGSPLRVHMIDCGLTVELGERDHKNLVKILGSLIKRDGYAAGKLMVDTAKKCQATELDVEMFCRGMEKICIDDEDNNFLESVGDYITDICYLACKHKVKLEAAFINAALACEIMEGLASSLYPDMQVQRIALPMVLKAEMMHDYLREHFSAR